ncbi:MAG TPA: hypothetical protein VLA12_10755 [Planctomycetaceae bacterium]|nr:hypothetical protein [Planctomycetaceae bacterium]
MDLPKAEVQIGNIRLIVSTEGYLRVAIARPHQQLAEVEIPRNGPIAILATAIEDADARDLDCNLTPTKGI